LDNCPATPVVVNMKDWENNTYRMLPVVSLCFLMALGAVGCLGYRLGSTLPPGIRSVYVPVFVNDCKEPQVETVATSATIQEFQRDGTLRIAAADVADSILEVTLTDFELEPLRYDPDQVKRTSEYRLRLTAHIIFTRRDADEVLLEREVQGESTFVPSGDLSSSKRSALPEATRDLAHDIVESVVEFW